MMLISHAAAVGEPNVEQTAVITMPIEDPSPARGWFVERRADEENPTSIWAKEKGEGRDPDNGGIWSVEKR